MGILKLFLFIFASLIVEGKILKCKIVYCPNCEFSLSDTFVEFALKYINGNGPSDGLCSSASQKKYIFKGKDVEGNRDACCCFEDNPNSEDCNLKNSERKECPDNPGIGKMETIASYFKRMGSFMQNAPTDGCCREGTYKWIFPQALTGTTDVCVCVTDNKAFSEKVVCIDVTSSSSSVEI